MNPCCPHCKKEFIDEEMKLRCPNHPEVILENAGFWDIWGERHEGPFCRLCWNDFVQEKRRQEGIGKEAQDVKEMFKKIKSGLRKCPGHPKRNNWVINSEGQCNICGGWKK